MPGALRVSWSPRHLIEIWDNFKRVRRSLGGVFGCQGFLLHRFFICILKFPGTLEFWKTRETIWGDEKMRLICDSWDFLENVCVLYEGKGQCWAGSWNQSIPSSQSCAASGTAERSCWKRRWKSKYGSGEPGLQKQIKSFRNSAIYDLHVHWGLSMCTVLEAAAGSQLQKMQTLPSDSSVSFLCICFWNKTEDFWRETLCAVWEWMPMYIIR